MKTWVRSNKIYRDRYLALAAVVLLSLTIAACGRSNVQAATPAMPTPLVTVVKATAQDVPRYLDEIGGMPPSSRSR